MDGIVSEAGSSDAVVVPKRDQAPLISLIRLGVMMRRQGDIHGLRTEDVLGCQARRRHLTAAARVAVVIEITRVKTVDLTEAVVDAEGRLMVIEERGSGAGQTACWHSKSLAVGSERANRAAGVCRRR